MVEDRLLKKFVLFPSFIKGEINYQVFWTRPLPDVSMMHK
jgi:hypothetical protein